MRITGGTNRGRILKTPDGIGIRPTQDRVREALFNILMHDIADARFLDLFAGSGSVGLEALSRGAKSCTFVEKDKAHLKFLNVNCEALRLQPSQFTVVAADAYEWLKTLSPTIAGFDIAFADPPYDLGVEHGYADMLALLVERNIVRTGGLFVAEMTSRQTADAHPRWDLCRDREYGKTRIVIWKRNA